jgi:hypothetical protein
MQFEEFDKKIREAAEHHHPAYDEKAWDKMGALLDKHLPQEKERKRRFFWLWFFGAALLLGGAGIFIARPWKSENKITEAKNTLVEKSSSVTTLPDSKIVVPQEKNVNTSSKQDETIEQPVPLTSSSQPTSAQAVIESDQSVKTKNTSVGNEKVNTLSVTTSNVVSPKKELSKSKIWGDNSVANKSIIQKKKSKKQLLNNPIESEKDIVKDEDVKDVEVIKSQPEETKPVVNDKLFAAADSNKDVTSLSNTDDKKLEKAKIDSTVTKEVAEKKDTKAAVTKTTKKKSSYFFFTGSAGPDVSFVSSAKAGSVKLNGGIGVGYNFNNKLILRTGFYTGTKIYSAQASAYKPPVEFYTYYPYLERVNANCRIYEIPVLLSYNFSKSTKQQFFATAGISSLIMKRETYNYFYKYTPTGPLYNKEKTYDNQNKHLFSVLTLSAGYKLGISKSVFIMAEPYIKMPLVGVGYGKVKLNSGGFLFSIGIRPFNKKQ